MFKYSNLSAKQKNSANIVMQIGVLIVFWWLGSMVQSIFHLPVSAAFIGLLMMLTGLMTGVVKLQWIKSGSSFMLSHLVLFFLPPFVGLINYQQLFIKEGWQLLITVVTGTICVMAFTAYSVFLGFKLEEKLKQRSLKSVPPAAENDGEQP
ncbi:CidA/LrgA family protein [Acinetobacter sp. WZC-1]|uniref:CidA/LrgA family protein n=1 Tax=Acinetobacter sp. WZC-1 TaxID=3459034 RepID=UPI00403DE158